jgi:hypothetical protein
MKFLSLHFMMVVNRVRALRAKKGWDLLIVTRGHLFGVLLLAHVQGTRSSIAQGVGHFPFALEVSRIWLIISLKVGQSSILLKLT